MRVISEAERAGMERTQQHAMMDRCLIHSATVAADAWGKERLTYSEGVSSICGYQPTGTTEPLQDNHRPAVDATVRLPNTAIISERSQVTLTHRLGRPITPIRFDIVGMPQPGVSAIVINLRKIL